METKHWAFLVGAALIAIAGYYIISDVYGYVKIQKSAPGVDDVFANLK